MKRILKISVSLIKGALIVFSLLVIYAAMIYGATKM